MKSRSNKQRQAAVPHAVLQAYRLQMAGDAVQAERLYLDVLATYPHEFNSLHQLGLIRRERGDHDGALAYMEAAVRANRTSTEALSNRGLILQELGRHREAIDSFNRAVVIDRSDVVAIFNRGISLLALDRLQEALASFDRVLALAPGHVEALYNRGNVLRELRRHDAALASYREALVLRPDDAEVRVNEALTRLRLGDLIEGFRGYEWRWKRPDVAALQRPFAQPLWLGQVPLRDRTILLHAEQGFGDTIQFVRYAGLAARQGAKVILEVQPALVALTAGLPGVSAVIGRGEPLPPFDLHCPLLSLPLAFATDLATIPAAVPYLTAPSDRVTTWQGRLPREKPLRIGIVWAGSASYRLDAERSLSLGQLAPLWSDPDIQCVSIQREPRIADAAILAAHPALRHVGAELQDFADTAAVIAVLDVVVSIDTAVAHLAGALGKPVLIMLPFSPDFRWILDRDDSPWYPTARLIRQQRRGDWGSVVAQVRRELASAAW
ncbi:MAG TPA: tetratricopeptide repeat-containing glycosyltransferase family protein [Xanthobacteraceae bacterium]|nr:tetratricopeptide repeat-containing glycosyltransferase family protein [Xanthobacteraceae bacterium]